MPIQIKGVGKPKGGGGGMDIATKKDAMVDKMSKAMASTYRKNIKMINQALNAGRLSNQDVERILKTIRAKKAGGGKAKKMMAKGGTAGGKKKMMGGGKAKKMMKGGGKTKKMMAGGGKTKKMMRGSGKTKKYMARGGKAR